MTTAERFRKHYLDHKNTVNRCYVTLRNKVKARALSSKQWGGDDIMYQFEDGSMLLDRTIVREFQLFKR